MERQPEAEACSGLVREQRYADDVHLLGCQCREHQGLGVLLPECTHLTSVKGGSSAVHVPKLIFTAFAQLRAVVP